MSLDSSDLQIDPFERLEALLDAEAHLLLCRAEDKHPIESEWEKHPADRARVLAHARGGGLIGLIPGSLGLLVVDVDVDKTGTPEARRAQCKTGGEAALAALGEPLAKHWTRSWGAHLWYRAPEGEVRNQKWDRGDIRGSRGFVVLWDPAAAVRALHAKHTAEPVDLEKLIQPAAPKASTPDDLRQATEGDRNEILNAGVFADHRAGRLNDIRENEWGEAGVACGLPPEEVAKTIQSARAGAEKKPRQRPPAAARTGAIQIPADAKLSDPQLERVLEAIGVENRYNVRSDCHEWRPRGGGPFDWTKRDDRRVALWRLTSIPAKCDEFDKTGSKPLSYTHGAFYQALDGHASSRECDPFRVWLESLPAWDGRHRLEQWLLVAFPSLEEVGPLAAWASMAIPLACVWRAFEPGTKHDETVVLQGRKQGTGKSTALAWLFPAEGRAEWFTDCFTFHMPAKERVEAMQRCVLIEAPEMSGATRADVERTKAFLTSCNDGSYRLAYRRDPESRPRRSVIVGTANCQDVLPNDPTGLRRWVVLRVKETGAAHSDRVRATLDSPGARIQIWAEAVARYRSGRLARLPDSLKADQEIVNEDFRAADESAEKFVEDYALSHPGPVSLADLADTDAARRFTAHGEGRLTLALKSCGFVCERKRWPGLGNCRRWDRSVSPLEGVPPVPPVPPLLSDSYTHILNTDKSGTGVNLRGSARVQGTREGVERVEHLEHPESREGGLK